MFLIHSLGRLHNGSKCHEPAGYHMLKSLEIQNFRGFERLSLSKLARINIVTGPNASGKTALLEAILLGTRGIPYGIEQIRQARGVPLTNIGLVFPIGAPLVTPETFRAQWDELFYNLDTERVIRIEYSDSNDRLFKLEMAYSNVMPRPEITAAEGAAVAGHAVVIGGLPAFFGGPTSVTPFVMQRSKDGGSIERINITLDAQNRIVHEPINEPLGPASAFFGSFNPYAEQDNVIWFSSLSASNLEKEVVTLLQQEFDFIKGLSVLAPFGVQAIWADLGDKKLPVSLISSGVRKFLTLILASCHYKGGVIIIDEIENGIFHERYQKFWSILYRLCERNDNQLFVSSHSLDCLRALVPVIEKHEQDFCLLRTTQEDRKIVVRQVSGAPLHAALVADSEVR